MVIVAMVKIVLHGYLKEAAGMGVMSIATPPDLAQAIQLIGAERPELKAKMEKGAFVVLLNGMSMIGKLPGEVALADGDEITFVPFVAGG